MERAKDIKEGLESPPGIAGTSVAECKINQSESSAGATNNKILGITKYDNFSANDCDVNSGLQASRKTDFSDVFLFSHKHRTIVPFLSKLIGSQ